MPSNFRRIVAKWVTGALFTLLIASFALWGVGDIFRAGGGTDVVVEVGEQTMTQNQFARAFRQRYNQLRQQVGAQLDMETARQMGLVDQIVQRIITEELFNAQAKDMNLLVSDDQLVRRISQQQAFYDAQGQFSRARFEQVLRMSGLTEADYVKLLRADVHRQQLVSAVTGGVAVPDTLAELLYRYRHERRLADYVVLPDDSFEVASPTDSALRSYYQENQDAFMAPEFREVSLIHLTAEQLVDEVRVGEDELRQAYESRREQFEQPERRRIRQIVLDSESAARRAVGMLQEGRTLDAVAQEISGGTAIDLGLNRRDELLPGLADEAFALEPGAVSAPVETTLGWHVLKVAEVVPPETRSFEEVRDQLRQDLARDKAIDSLVSLANSLDDELAGGASLEQAADTLGLQTRHIPAVSREGNAPDGEPVGDLPGNGEFLQLAFETPQGQQSLLEETEAGGYFVLRVDGVTPPQPRPFEAVTEEVRQRYLQDQRREKARAAAEEIRKAVDGGESLKAVAAERGLDVRTTQPLRRNQNPGASPAGQAMAGQLFDLEKNGTAVVATQDAMVVARLSEVRTPEPDSAAQQMSGLRQDLQAGIQNDMLTQFVEALRTRHEVRVYQDRLDQVLNRFQ